MNRKMLFTMLGVILITCSITVYAEGNPSINIKTWFMAEWDHNLATLNDELKIEQSERFGELDVVIESYMSEISLEDDVKTQIEQSENRIRAQVSELNNQLAEVTENLMDENLEVDKQKVMEEVEQEILSIINEAFK